MHVFAQAFLDFDAFRFRDHIRSLLVRTIHAPPVPAYMAQLVVSVEANFLANFRWTWKDRNVPFGRAFRRYNLKRAAGVLFSLSLYPFLIRLGMNYLLANALIVALLTPANYILGHLWTFAPEDSESGVEAPSADLEPLAANELGSAA